MNNYINYIYGRLGLILGFVISIVYKQTKKIAAYIKTSIGDSNYNLCKEFLTELAKLHPEDFAEDKLTDLLDKLDNKFGDHLSRNTIKDYHTM